MFSVVSRVRPVLAFVAIVTTVLAMPVGVRLALSRWAPRRETLPPSYLPALDEPRRRAPFDAWPIHALQESDPSYVIIGDSMAGRIDFAHLEQLAHGSVMPLLQNATGSAYWYLVFKNYVVKSGVHPRWVLVFFRDTNLTDPLFRIGDAGARHLDEVALDREDELNGAIAKRVDPWFRPHRLVSRMYGADELRDWLEPKLSAWAAAQVAPDARRRASFLTSLNRMFALEHLRPMAAADVAVTQDDQTDFAASVDSSVLPPFLDLARSRGLHVCFVRVLRRPENQHPQPESERMARYVRDLRAYIESHGGVLRDDRDDPDMATIEYADGDHIARGERVRYTDLFYARTSIFK